MDIERVRPWAETLREGLAQFAEEVVVVGSMRRGKEDIKDLELVARLPARPADPCLFGEPIAPPPDTAPLDDWIVRMMDVGLLEWDEQTVRRGPKYKRFVLGDKTDLPNFVFELFLSDRDNHGNTVAIRTGSAAFSKWFMTARQYGGGMPWGLRQADGYLWHKTGTADTHYPNGYERLSCPDEAAYFCCLGLPVLPPYQRNEEVGIPLLRREIGAAR